MQFTVIFASSCSDLNCGEQSTAEDDDEDVKKLAFFDLEEIEGHIWDFAVIWVHPKKFCELKRYTTPIKAPLHLIPTGVDKKSISNAPSFKKVAANIKYYLNGIIV